MENIYFTNDDFQDTDRDFENIMSINNFDASADELDFNFDYNPNEIYYELAARKF
jgi:phage-related protein